MKKKRPKAKLMFLLVILLMAETIVGQTFLQESFNGETYPPTFWTEQQISGTGLWGRWTSGSNPVCSPKSGEGMIGFNSYSLTTGTSAVIISPKIDFSGTNGLKLQFWMYRDNGITSKNDVVKAYVNTVTSLTGAYLLGTINRPITSDPVVAENGWYRYEFDIPADFSGTENYILINAISQRGMNMFVDDIRVYIPEAADSPPINFSAPDEDISQTSFSVSWDDNSTNEIGFRVYYSTDDINFVQYGTDIISTTQAQIGENYSCVLTNLLPGTTYYIRISAFRDIDSEYLTDVVTTDPPDVIRSLETGNWNEASTWDSGTIPTAVDNVVIEDGHTVTLNADGFFNSLTVNGTLQFQAFNLSGVEISISETGSVSIAEGNTANLSVAGNISNTGTFNFYISDFIYGGITFTGTHTQTFNASGTTNIGTITIDKGSSYNNVAEIVTNGTFTIRSGAASNFLNLFNGTLKISGTASVSNNVFPSGGYTIPATGGIWLNNPNFSVLGQSASATNNGLFRLSSGTYNVGTSSNNSFGGGTGSVFIIENGTLNVASRFGSANTLSFTMSGGVINVNSISNSSSNTASFGLSSTLNTINISGGTINLINPSTATTPLDYNVQGSNINITGGTLNIGKETTSSPYTFRIEGNTPSVVIDNTINPKTVLLSDATNVLGNITINSGSTLNTQSSTIQIIGNSSQKGNVINDGLITNTSPTGSNRFSFVGLHGEQTLSGAGTLGDGATPFSGIVFSNSSGIILESPIVTNRVILQKGIVSGSNNITLGNGGASMPVVQRGGSSTAVVGSFDQSPVFNPGSSYSVIYSTGLNPYTTGFELPASLSGKLELAANYDITLGASSFVEEIKFASTNTANIITSNDYFLTVNGSFPDDIIIESGNSGYVMGPLARTLPSSLTSGSEYIFPIGKSENNFLELVNPTTTAGGQVVIKAEVFDEASGGSEGLFIQDASLQNRYWKTEIISGADNFVNTKISITQSNPTLTPENGLARSSTLTGSYDLVSSDQPVGNKLTSDEIDELGYFSIGVKQLTQIYQSSTTTHPDLDLVMAGETNQLILGIEIVTLGNSPALQVSNIDFSTNGTSDLSDIANAKLFYTGTSSTFTTDIQVGLTISSPSTTFSINPAQDLLEGTNYFWLVYDIAEDATDKNLLDAECTSITVGGTPYVPTITAPVGARTIRTFLSGTYLVGTGSNYSTLTEAIADLNLVGINAPVHFMLIDEDYSISESFPLTVNQIINSSSNNYVVIKPATGITPEIVGTSDNPIFVINTSNFGIDGSNTIDGITRDITITNNGTGASSGLILATSGTGNLSFKNIVGVGGAKTAGCGIVLDGINNGEVLNCCISKSLIGIQTKGNSNQILISENELGSTLTEDKIHTSAIAVENTSNFSITNNVIKGILSESISTSSGIKISGSCTNGTIVGNEIRDIKNTLFPGYGSNGVWINSSSTTSNIKVYNNVISDIASYGFSGWDVGNNGYGIVLSSGGGYGVYFNTILLNTDQTSTNSRTAGLNISSAITTASTLDVRNNIIVNTQTLGTRYAVYCAAPNTVFADINYNNYRAPTGVGFIGGSARTTLANWQTGTGKDANSLNLLPFFTSTTDLSLVNNKNCPLDGAGTPIAGITTDFFGVTRNATKPDMGAIEFTTVLFGAPVADFDEVCYGETSGLLTLTEYEGTITGWESSTSPFGEWSSIANTLNTYTSGSLYENTRFRTLVNNGLCTNFATEYVEVAVSPETVGGSVTGGSDICNGQTSGLLTLANHVGDVVRWESSVDPFDTWTPIVNTLTTYTSNALPETTRFRAVVKSGVCDELPSEHTEVIVFPVSFGGTVSGGTTICSGETSSELTLSGNVGDVVRWEYSVNGTDWFAIVNTETTYTSGALTETTHFRAVVQNGPCDEAASEHTTVTVDPPSVGGAVTGGTSVCSGQTSGLLTLSGHTGDIVRWERSVLPFDTWNTIDNTLSTYTSGAITEVTRFRAVVKSGVCSVATSDYTDVTISPPTVGGSVTGGTTICEGETSGVLTLSGHTGDIIKWQSSTNLTDWTDIANTVTTYTSGALAQTTHFRAVVKSGGCDALESSHTTVTVNPIPIAVITTTAPLTYCEEEDISAALTATPAGGTYRWFKNDVVISGATSATFTATSAGSFTAEVTVNGCSDISEAKVITVNTLPNAVIATTDALTYCEGDAISVTFTATPAGGTYRWFKNGTVISGATLATFSATSAGHYSAEVTVNGCSDLSDAIEIVVNPLPNAAISTSNALTYCEGDEISVTFTASPAGGTYRWFKNGTVISGATSATYSATSAGNYTAEVTVNGCLDISEAKVITVNPLPNAEIATTDALTYCEGDEISVTFTASPAGGTYRWFKDDVLISGATSASYIATSAGNYSAEVTVNGCSGFSNELEILVNPTPIPVVSTVDNLNYCFGDEISVEFTVDISAEAYQWFKNESPINGETGPTYKATEEGFYSVGVMVNGCPGISNEIEIVVNPLPITSLPTDTVFLPNYESYLFDAGAGFAAYLWFDESTEQTYLFDGEAWGLGVYEIWVEVTNEFGCTTRDSVTVSVGHVGVSTMESLTANIFPNPNSGRFTISLNGVSSKNLRISIFNAMGQAVYTKDFRVNASHFNETITLNEKAKGIYFISISDGKGITTKRIVIE